MAFAVVVLSSCGLFLLQAAPFLAAATVIIYAGAIIVTFLFVLMLSQQAGLSNANDRSREPFLAVGFGFLLVATLYLATQSNYQTAALAELAVEADRARLAATASSQFEAAKLLGEPVNDFLMRALGTEEGAWDPIREADRRRLVDPVKAAGAAFVAARPDEKISDALEKLDGLDSWWETAERLAQLVSAVTSRPADPARDELLAKATASMKEADERFWKLAQERLRGLAREGSRDRWETGRLAPTPPLAMSDATRVGVVELIERLEKFTPKETPDATKDDFMDRVLFFRDGIFPEKDKETWPPGADKFVNAVSEAYTPIRRRQEFTDATRTLLRRAADTGRPLLRSSSPSSASGLPSNTPYEKVPLGRDGRPAVPAANVAAVGRSLFTDYLLAVEMGGTLLLVATIGAIAITARRSEGPA
jgi:NADH:ubiquinone oxidoreductase subunit 6 (subunit J)